MRDGWQAPAAFAERLGDNDDMNIQLNGEARTLPDPSTLLDLLQAEQLLERRVAVEVNGEIVTRSLHASHVLADGDVVEIVHALGGG
ncbi:sulfur carrier protein ThiS [Stenotrophomonas tumulicola]